MKAKFMPYRPVRKVIGRKMKVTMVTIFSFLGAVSVDRYPDIAIIVYLREQVNQSYARIMRYFLLRVCDQGIFFVHQYIIIHLCFLISYPALGSSQGFFQGAPKAKFGKEYIFSP